MPDSSFNIFMEVRLNDSPMGRTRGSESGPDTKKAKRKSLIRSIVISLLVTLLTLTAIFFGAAQLVAHRSAETKMSEWKYLMISSPNEYTSSYRDNRGFLSGVLEMNTYKIIEGVPVPWNEKWFNYNEWWFPFATGAYGEHRIWRKSGRRGAQTAMHTEGSITRTMGKGDGLLHPGRGIRQFNPQ